jgi:signal transduction histidine kinase
MKPIVLIVDDNKTNVELLSAKLGEDGYELVTASNGVEAVEKAISVRPDLILLDILMPRMDGYEACRILKSRDETRYIPVVMLTARAELGDKMLGLELGAEDYITKPFSPLEVSARVKSILKMRALQSKLRDSEKMAALGEMVDGIAHEVRNPLVTIGGMARRLYEHETDEEHKRYAQNILTGVERLERMIHRIDEYKGVLSSTLVDRDVNRVILDAVNEARDYAGEGEIDIRTSFFEESSTLRIDATNLKIAISNMLHNSVDAIEGSGVIRVETRSSEEGFLIVISDTGCGMDEASIRTIFHPFHTSKMTGAGLGLTVSHRIIADHGGEIIVTSGKGQGATFTVILPIETPITPIGAGAGV